ncbi:PAS domain-containing protein, partial [Escherichia coli]|uniref:PAS domain-containing protein n=1 Tax=Escherichia coli TaxID=562 RepID=UPI0019543D5A
DLAKLREQHSEFVRETETVRAFLSGLPMPVWIRDGEGRLTWVNEAYASATDSESGPQAVAGAVELLEPADRAEAARCRTAREPFAKRVT